MESHCLPASSLPHTSALYAAFLDDFPRVSSFFPHPPTEAGLLASAREALRNPGPASANRTAVTEILREQHLRHAPAPDPTVLRNLDRLANGAVAVVTGQQVGLFGGPAYSFYKALSAIHLARRLTDLGTDAVPVFWLATEDHDLAEINHTFAFNHSRVELERYTLAVENPDTRRVGEIPLSKNISTLLDSLSFILTGPARSEILRALSDSYLPNETFGSAFARLFTRLFAGRGLLLLDPLDERLHRLAAPLFRRAIEEAPALTSALLAQNKSLEAAGFHAQVKVTAPGTLLFLSENGARLPIHQKNGAFLAGRSSFSPSQLLARLDASPLDFSPNALFRPLVQDTLLPTAAYLGGPAEIAYFAQARILYNRLLPRMPLIAPRASFTLIEPAVARLLKKYSLSLPDLFRGRQHLRSHLERLAVPPGLSRKFESAEKSLAKLLASFRSPLKKLDPTLLGALENSQKKMLFHLTKLRQKSGRAAEFRSGVLARHESLLADTLFPNKAPQERSLSAIPFLASHGLALLDSLDPFCSLPSASSSSPSSPSSSSPSASPSAFCHHLLYL